ncbi:MAG: YchF/TatD family DNA exonuclease [Candidatus Lindowbacteria bacterium]|nr:YchF/TatD family DNA exonuclease [Candidatus Lindowbacteria bacterium]
MIDSHAHLQMPEFAGDWSKVLDNTEAAGIEYVVIVGFDIESSRRAVALCEQSGKLLASVGVHPHDASSLDASAMDELRRLARHPKVVAIGETGLDFYRNLSPREKQHEAFEAQLAMAEELGLPVVVHDRDAHAEVREMLSRRASKLVGGVMHCFSGDVQLAREALEWGFYISMAGPLTYPNAAKLRSVTSQIPTERMLIETDAPYLAPQPKRGMRNEPAFVRFVAEELARVKGLSMEDIDRITTLNAKQLFGLPLSENGDVIVYPIRDSLYINVTGACTNECSFCTRFKSPYVKGHNLSLKRDPSAEEIIRGLTTEQKRPFKEAVFCGLGEPFLRLDVIKQVARYLKERGYKVRVNTNGQANLIYGRNIVPELEGLIDSVSISLNSSDSAKYFDLCRPRFGPQTFSSVLEFIRECKKYIPDVSVTALDIDPSEIEACKNRRCRCR